MESKFIECKTEEVNQLQEPTITLVKSQQDPEVISIKTPDKNLQLASQLEKLADDQRASLEEGF